MPRKPIWIIAENNRVIVKGNAKLILEADGFRGLYVGTVRGWILDPAPAPRSARLPRLASRPAPGRRPW